MTDQMLIGLIIGFKYGLLLGWLIGSVMTAIHYRRKGAKP